MKCIFLFAWILLTYTSPLFAGGGGHCGAHGCHGAHGAVGGHSAAIKLKKHPAEIILFSGDSLQGIVKLGERNHKIPGILFQQDSSCVPRFIADTSVWIVKIKEADSTLMTGRETCFYNLDRDKHLWRMLYNGTYQLYDDALFVNENPGQTGNKVFGRENNNIYKISGLWSLSAFSDLLHFINKHYQQSFRGRDFKNRQSLLRYIAQQETAQVISL